MTKVLVFDFDGVIVRRSEFFKRDAWASVFSSYGDRYKSFLQDTLQKFGGGRGGDRYDILKKMYLALGERGEDMLGLIEKGAKVFDTYVQSHIREAGILDEDRAMLQRLSGEKHLYLNSATPVEALIHSAKTLGIDGYFVGMLGRPNSKIENFKYIVEKEGVEPSEILFVGDAESDYKAAQEFGCAFVGLANDWNKWKGEDARFPIVRSLAELRSFDIVL